MLMLIENSHSQPVEPSYIVDESGHQLIAEDYFIQMRAARS